jgi:pimeloyl-ACP methyl ester carboxylesterase
VLESPFTSVRAMGRAAPHPARPRALALVARVHWDTAERVAALDAPVWVAHGARDQVIPARMGAACTPRRG